MSYRLTLAVIASVAAIGCGSSSSPAGAPKDAGSHPDSGKMDSGTLPDVGTSAEAGPAPAGTLLVPGDSLQLFGVTSDGFAIYSDNSGTKTTLNAVPVAGGAPKLITDLINGGSILVAAQVVMVWPGLSTNNVGALSVWTAAGGTKSLVPILSYANVANVSTDGTHVAYINNSNNAGTVGDLWVAGSDGSNPTSLVTGIALQGACAPQVAFAGSYAIASYCDAATADGGVADAGADAGAISAVATVANFTGATWTKTVMVTGAYDYWSTDTAGTQVLVTTGAGDVQVLPLPTGTATTLDTGGSGVAILRQDGTAALYNTLAGALKRSPITSPAPVTLVATGVGGITAVSPDDNWTLYYKSYDSASGLSDLYLASTVTAGTPITLASTVSATDFGEDFTSDSKTALFYAMASTIPAGLIGTLSAQPTGGGASAALDMNTWSNLAAAGTKVVLNDNFVQSTATTTVGFGFADLKSVDVSKTGPATLIVPSADATPTGGPLLNAAKDHIVYTFSASTGGQGDAGVDSGADTNGLYIVPIP